MIESLLREAMDEAQIPRGRKLAPTGTAPGARTPLVVVVGLGGDGLETAQALQEAGGNVAGIELGDLTRNEGRLSEADAVVICVAPMPGEDQAPDFSSLRAACAAVCRRARRGQTIVLASTVYVGATRELLTQPLAELGFELGTDICVACAPPLRPQVLGADGELCAEKGMAVIGAIATSAYLVASPEEAEAFAVELAELVGERP